MSRQSRAVWLRGPGALYLLAAALGLTALSLGIWGWRVARRLDAQVTRAAAEHGELVAREFAEVMRLVTDAASARVFGVLQEGGATWSGDIPRRIEEALGQAPRGDRVAIVPGSGGTFAWRSDRPERIDVRGIDATLADGIRRQLIHIAPTFTNERAAPILIKTDADGREILVPAFFRARGSLVQVAGYMSSPRLLADSILIPIAEQVTHSRYGEVMWQMVAWRFIRPGGDTVATLGAFVPGDPMVASAFFRPRFQAARAAVDSAAEAEHDPDPAWTGFGTRRDPRRFPYMLEVQVHPQALGVFLYGATLAPAAPIAALFTLALLLTIATVALSRRFVRHVQEREAFASAVAHDLRTPLTQILLYGESMQLDRPAVHSREEAARVIVRETRRLIHMVENALQFARGGRAQPTPNLEPLPLGAVVRETVESMAPILARTGVSASVEGLVDLQVRADRGALVQVLTNLIENAVRFGPAGQRITLSLTTAAGFAAVSVDDQGPGIAPDLRNEVFRPFVRTGQSPGTGIGLAVSRQLAELMDGSLDADAAPGGGARLVLRLPLAR